PRRILAMRWSGPRPAPRRRRSPCCRRRVRPPSCRPRPYPLGRGTHATSIDKLARMTGSDAVIDWLLDADPSIRWQVMGDLLDDSQAQWQAERAKVETEGWGASLLSCEDEDGQWAGGAFLPSGFDAREWEELGQPWTATTYSLSQLREFGLDPSSHSA